MKKREFKRQLIIILLICVPLLIASYQTIVNVVMEPVEELKQRITEIENVLGIQCDLNKTIYYKAIGDTVDFRCEAITKDHPTKEVIVYSSSDETIASVNNNGLVTCLQDGEVTITASLLNYQKEITIVSTSLIQIPSLLNEEDKEYLTEGLYSKEENDLLDTILEDRINDAGYATRAGVVEAARFLVLEFPYRIDYFPENGRLFHHVDGEGRYYHKGLYLDESRFDALQGSGFGPATWGQNLKHINDYVLLPNGLDCSGFVTWAMANGGYDPGELGAGGSMSNFALWDIGERASTSYESIAKTKAGDLVHNSLAGGHIGIIIGIDDTTIYVAQAIWYDTSGVVISSYSYDEFIAHWNMTILMDSYYMEDGNYTPMF